MKILAQTPSQTVGPFFAYGLTPFQYNYDFSTLSNNVLFDDFSGQKIKITGSVFDGQGNEIPDAIVEIWHAKDPLGKHSTENGFGRMGTGTEAKSRFVFETFKPNSQNNLPFISVIVFMRGLLIHTYTRIYFEDEADQNAKDLVFAQIPESRQKTLLAKKVSENEYQFDIHMQGPNETVFFEIID